MTRSDLPDQIGTGFGGDDRARLTSGRFTGGTSQTTQPQPDHHGQAAEVMLSMSPPRPRVDEKLPSSAPETSPRCRGSFVASLPIVAPARGSENAAAGAAGAHWAAAQPARRRGEERPHSRCHDGVEAPLRHCARHAAAPPAGVALQRFALRLACPVLFFSAARQKLTHTSLVSRQVCVKRG